MNGCRWHSRGALRQTGRRCSTVIPTHQTRPSDDLIFALNGEAQRRKAAGESIVNATVGHADERRRQARDAGDRGARRVHEVPRDEWAAYAPIAGTGRLPQGRHPRLLPGRAATSRPSPSPPRRRAAPARCATRSPTTSSPARRCSPPASSGARTRPSATSRTASVDDLLDVRRRRQPRRRRASTRSWASCSTKQGRVLLFLNDPCHNPTGYSMTPRRVEARW